jgi:metal-responsive CopG/Arc/MetJ family transcriptional regulator
VSPVGRPVIGQPINIRLSDALMAAVDRLADRQGKSRAETIRMILDDYFANETE